MDSLNTTSYSREEIAEARQGLRLLKERMANLGMSKRKGTTQSGNRERSYQNQSYTGGPGASSTPGGSSYNMPHIQGALPPNQRRTHYGNASHTQSANKPPIMPSAAQNAGANDVMNTSSLSGIGNNSHHAIGKGYGGPTGSTPRSLGTSGASNYRRAFKPTLTPAGNTSHSAAFSTLNSEDRAGGNTGQTLNQFYENPVVNRQSLNSKLFGNEAGNRPPQTFYEPARRSPNMARRQISRDNDPSNSAASAHSRAVPHSINTDKYSESRNAPGGLGATANSQRRIPSHLPNGQNSRPYPQNGYGTGTGAPPSYDSRKYAGVPDRSTPKNDGANRSTNQFGSYRQPSPLKTLKQGMDRAAAAEPDPFSSKPRMQHTPPKGRPSPMSMKSQPKQFPQVTQSGTGYQYGQQYNSSPSKPIGGPTDAEYAEGQERIPCSTCGRKFAPESLEKHERICTKTSVQKRKAFDAREQRQAEQLEKTTMNEFSKPFGLKKGNKRGQGPAKTQAADEQPVNAKKMPKWKLQSLQFRQAMMSANGGGNATAGGFRPVQEMSALDEIADDRIQCKWCSRKFNKEAGERHFRHCEDQYKKNLMKQGGKQSTKRGTQVGFMKRKY